MIKRLKSKLNLLLQSENMGKNVVLDNVNFKEEYINYNDFNNVILCWIDVRNQLQYNQSSIEFFINSNFTTSNILAIRKRIEDRPKDKYIQSVMDKAFSNTSNRLHNADYFRNGLNNVLTDRLKYSRDFNNI